jgi:hypothetical protein
MVGRGFVAGGKDGDGDDGVDGTIEEHERRMRLDSAKSGDELGQAQEVERVDASNDPMISK